MVKICASCWRFRSDKNWTFFRNHNVGNRIITSEIPFDINNRPIVLVGLSKERPILGHHAKAHIFEIRRISCEIHAKPYKIRCFNKNSSVWGGAGRGLWSRISCEICRISQNPPDFMKSAGFHMESAGFHEIERPLARNCNPMFLLNCIYVHFQNDRDFPLPN